MLKLKKRTNPKFVLEVEGLTITCRRFDPVDSIELGMSGGSGRGVADAILRTIEKVEPAEATFEDGTAINAKTIREFGDQALISGIVMAYTVLLNAKKAPEAEEKKDAPKPSDESATASEVI